MLEALCHFAAQTPDKIALEQGEARFSYEALLARSEQMAAALQAAGVAPGDKVGSCWPAPPVPSSPSWRCC